MTCLLEGLKIRLSQRLRRLPLSPIFLNSGPALQPAAGLTVKSSAGQVKCAGCAAPALITGRPRCTPGVSLGVKWTSARAAAAIVITRYRGVTG